MKAMIFAAGLGTRLKPLTNSKPKALVEINGIPLLQIVISNLKKHGFNDIIINVHHFAGQIKEFLRENNNFNVNINISDESEKLLNTGGGLKKARHFFDDKPFLVHNVDIISDLNLKDLYNYHLSKNAIATLAVRNRKTSRYFLFDKNMALCGWKNFKTNETKLTKTPASKLYSLAFSGIQVINPEIFSLIQQEGAFSITDVYINLANSHYIAAYIHDDTLWMDMGKPENIAEAEKIFNKIYTNDS